MNHCTQADREKEKASFSCSCQNFHGFPVWQKTIRQWWEISESHWGFQCLKDYWDPFQFGDKLALIPNMMYFLFHRFQLLQGAHLSHVPHFRNGPHSSLKLIYLPYEFATSVLLLWKNSQQEKRTPPNYYKLSLQKKSHMYRNKSHNVFSSHANECLFFFFSVPYLVHSERHAQKFLPGRPSAWFVEAAPSPTHCSLAQHPQTKLDPKHSCYAPSWIFQICMNCAVKYGPEFS